MNRSKKKSFDWYGARQRFSIRKYHIGAASVLLGMTLVLGTGTIVSAETGVNGGGSTHQPVDEPIIKFPTQDNQAQPAGYEKVEFSTAYSTLVFEGNPGEIQNGNSKTVVFWVKTGTTWGTLVKDPQFRIPKYTVADGDFILSYASNVGQVAHPIDLDSLVNNALDNTALANTPIVGRWQINTIVDYIVGDVSDGRTFEEYMNSGAYAPFQIPQFHGITLDANGGTVGGKAKKAFYVAYKHVQWGDQRVTSKIVDPSRDGYTFVRWQTATGEGIPTSGQIDTIEFTAVWLEHPTDKVAVFDRTNLTDSEKEQVKKKIYDANPDLSTGVAQVIKAIEISDTGEATVTFDDDKVVTVPSTTLINEDQDTARSNAKAEIEREATEKSDAINASNLTEEEKREKLDEVNNAKAAADSAIDQASTSDEL
ncbi:TPA: YSIRK-type signal peptide-containing protein, partial [Streptococcus suis]